VLNPHIGSESDQSFLLFLKRNFVQIFVLPKWCKIYCFFFFEFITCQNLKTQIYNKLKFLPNFILSSTK
jgi:hypothetical protein